jgi:DNA-directed RNA polymerase specialized sigma24 family protein
MSAWVSIRFLQTQSDARLLALARDGHERAFEALVHRYRKPLLAYCRRMPVPGSTAEDAVQQGLLQAWVALQRGAEVRDAQPWLYRVVRNVTLRMLNGSDSEHAELS